MKDTLLMEKVKVQNQPKEVSKAFTEMQEEETRCLEPKRKEHKRGYG